MSGRKSPWTKRFESLDVSYRGCLDQTSENDGAWLIKRWMGQCGDWEKGVGDWQKSRPSDTRNIYPVYVSTSGKYLTTVLYNIGQLHIACILTRTVEDTQPGPYCHSCQRKFNLDSLRQVYFVRWFTPLSITHTKWINRVVVHENDPVAALSDKWCSYDSMNHWCLLRWLWGLNKIEDSLVLAEQFSEFSNWNTLTVLYNAAEFRPIQCCGSLGSKVNGGIIDLPSLRCVVDECNGYFPGMLNIIRFWRCDERRWCTCDMSAKIYASAVQVVMELWKRGDPQWPTPLW